MFLLLPAFVAYFFCALFLFTRKGKLSKTSIFLSLFYFFWGSAILSSFLATEKNGFFSPNCIVAFALLFFVFLLAIPPTIYVYSGFLLGRQLGTVLKQYYLIFVLLVINLASFIYLDSKPNSFLSELNENVVTYANYIALLFIFPLINIFYIYKSFTLYFKYKKSDKNTISFQSGVNLNWVLFFILGYLFFILLLLLDLSDIIPILPKSSFSVYSIIYFIYIGYNGFKQESILASTLLVTENENEVETGSRLFEGIEERLNKILSDEKPYLDSKLTLNQLAKQIGSNEKYLSNFLNTRYGMNFSTFINSHRIAESKELLLSEETVNFTIETIANMSGFHSKSTFNTAFKKATGLTPSDFKRNQVL
jgi:AraC-like DNA-binding protein